MRPICRTRPAPSGSMSRNASGTIFVWLAVSLRVPAPKLTAALGTALARPSPALFLPYLSGERTPVGDSEIRGVMMGLGHETDAKALTHAVLDGVAFAFRDCLEALKGA